MSESLDDQIFDAMLVMAKKMKYQKILETMEAVGIDPDSEEAERIWNECYLRTKPKRSLERTQAVTLLKNIEIEVSEAHGSFSPRAHQSLLRAIQLLEDR